MARLLLRGGVPEGDVEAALADAVQQALGLVTLLARDRPDLYEIAQRELERLDLPSLEIVRPHPELLARLPEGLAERLGALPVRQDARSGRIDVAVLDPLDPLLADELAYHLSSPVRLLRVSFAALRDALGAEGRPRSPSGPPLPLVKKAPAPSQDSARSAAVEAASHSGRAPDDGPEPVLSLARPKSKQAPVAPRAEVPRSSTAPVAAARDRAPPTLPTPEKSASDAEAAPKTAPSLPPLPASVLLLEKATTTDAVLEHLMSGFGPAGAVALAVRPQGFEGRAASSFLDHDAARRLRISAGSPSIVEAALKNGHYLGSLPLTPAHGELRALLGHQAEGEVYATPIAVSGRPSLLVVVALVPALGASLDATRRVDRLRDAAGQALERILVQRKRGGTG